jgi:hypothetical protein
LNEWLGAQRGTFTAQNQHNTCEQHYSKCDSSHLDNHWMTGWRVGLECEPKHAERKNEHGKNKQGLGDASRKGKYQKWRCYQQEPSTSNIACDWIGFDRARCRYEDPSHSEQGDARAYEEGESLCQSAEFHLGHLTLELSGGVAVRLERNVRRQSSRRYEATTGIRSDALQTQMCRYNAKN